MISALLFTLAGAVPLASAHIALWHPSMYGFNVTTETFHYDNRPVVPLMDMTFDQWWFHGHLGYPPNPGDFFELQPGQPATAELTCDKGQTSYFASSEGHTDLREGNNPCRDDVNGFPSGAMHTTGFDDLTGCALAIAYESDVKKIKPEDFTVFSVNHTCVWNRLTDFQVPERMPECPEDGCHCAWFWIHSPDSGGEQNYMNGFKCKVVNATSTVPLAKPQVPRRCGADPKFDKVDAALGNCTYGAKQPFYWFQKEVNNMFEGTYAPPFYTDLYNFKDGAQNDIFVDSYTQGLPAPNPNSTFVPTPNMGGSSAAPGGQSASTPLASSSIPSSSSAVPSSASSDAPEPSSTVSTIPNSSFSSSIPQTGSATASSSISQPDLPLSTQSVSVSFTISTSVAQSTSVTVSTSVVVSTVLVTVTSAPAPTSTIISGSVLSSPVSSSALPSSDSVAVNSAKASATTTYMATDLPPTATSVPVSESAAGSTIVLNVPTSGVSASDFAVRGATKDSVNGDAGSTITLSQKAEAEDSLLKPAVFAADTTASPTGGVCKRELGQRKVFRRRVPAAAALRTQEEAGSSSLFSWISAAKRSRKLSDRSRLWSFY